MENIKMRINVMKKWIPIVGGCLLASVLSLSAADVKAVWEKDCAKCHGADGKGDTKMGKKLKIKDYTDAKVQAAMTDEDMFKAVKEGVKDGSKTRMKPAQGLSDEEIKGLVKVVRGFKQ
jgi:cytochrome c553